MKPKTKRNLYVGLAVVVLASLWILKNTNYFFRALNFTITFLVFFLIDSLFKLKFRNRHYIILIIIITTGILLNPLYEVYPVYDKILHFITPILFCIVIFYLVNKLKEIPISTKIFLTLSIVISLLAVWEIIEFAIEELLGFRMQGVYIKDMSLIPELKLVMGKHNDTMMDLIMGTLGTIAFSIWKTIEYYLNKLKNKKKN